LRAASNCRSGYTGFIRVKGPLNATSHEREGCLVENEVHTLDDPSGYFRGVRDTFNGLNVVAHVVRLPAPQLTSDVDIRQSFLL
jgi:hypothetical protein